jgi:hypothetical protein
MSSISATGRKEIFFSVSKRGIRIETACNGELDIVEITG